MKEEAKDTFRLVEDTSKIPSSNAAQIPANLGLDLDEMNTDHHGEHDKKEHEDTVRDSKLIVKLKIALNLFQMVFNYVFAMLRSEKALTLERIYSLLCVYTFHGQHERTLIDVKNILDSKVRMNQLCYQNGFYTLPIATTSATTTTITTSSTAETSSNNENMITD